MAGDTGRVGARERGEGWLLLCDIHPHQTFSPNLIFYTYLLQPIFSSTISSMIPTILLLHGDCLELLPCITKASVALVLTDPPYGTTACKWDSVIPFEPMWKQVWRVLKPNGAAVFTASQPFTSALVMSNSENWKHSWVWDKGVGVNFMHAKRQPLKTTEDVMVFCLGTPRYFPQMTPKDKPTKKSNNVMGESSGYSVDGSDQRYVGKIYTESYPEMILSFSSRSAGSRGLHPTQKPVALMEYLIKTYTNEGETVLDFTMGSGTTGVACMNTGRNFIGIESDERYFQIASERIEQAKANNQSSTFSPPCPVLPNTSPTSASAA